jgi:hypothetical protein
MGRSNDEGEVLVPPALKGDTDNGDDLDFDDIPGFVTILTGGTVQHVPEPSSAVLTCLAAVCRIRPRASRRDVIRKSREV